MAALACPRLSAAQQLFMLAAAAEMVQLALALEVTAAALMALDTQAAQHLTVEPPTVAAVGAVALQPLEQQAPAVPVLLFSS
jgi:hypothetical protein